MIKARTDANQTEIVRRFREIGASVQVMSSVGKGFPDLIVGWRGRNILLELKDGSKPPSARALTVDQVHWHANWAGQVAVVTSVDQAVELVMREVMG